MREEATIGKWFISAEMAIHFNTSAIKITAKSTCSKL